MQLCWFHSCSSFPTVFLFKMNMKSYIFSIESLKQFILSSCIFKIGYILEDFLFQMFNRLICFGKAYAWYNFFTKSCCYVLYEPWILWMFEKKNTREISLKCILNHWHRYLLVRFLMHVSEHMVRLYLSIQNFCGKHKTSFTH